MADAPVVAGDLEGQLQVSVSSDAKPSEDPLVTFQAWHQKELSLKKKGSVRAFYESQDELAAEVLRDGFSGEDEDDLPAMARQAVNVSFGVNVVLFFAKMVIAITSGSLAVIASTADSALDLISGFILAHTQKLIGTPDPYNYPQGKGRLEPLGVVVFARYSIHYTLVYATLMHSSKHTLLSYTLLNSIMGMSALMVVTESVKILVTGFTSKAPVLDMGLAGYCVLGKLDIRGCSYTPHNTHSPHNTHLLEVRTLLTIPVVSTPPHRSYHCRQTRAVLLLHRRTRQDWERRRRSLRAR
jgi:hypothetical protein